MADANNIIVGAATVEINTVDIGFTQGGVEVKYSPTFFDIEADQFAGVVRKARSLEKITIMFNLLEATLANLRLSMMQPAGNLVGSVLTLGYNDACWVDELDVVITGKGPSCGTRIFAFPKCIAMGDKSYKMERTGPVVYAFEMEALKQGVDGTFGTITDS